jgi:hypothetical protein
MVVFQKEKIEMIREFLFRAYLVAFAGSVILGVAVGWDKGGLFTGIGIGLAVAAFWLVIGWICQPLFKSR